MKVVCYLAETGDNPVVNAIREEASLANIPPVYDPYVVEVKRINDDEMQIFIHLKGKLIAHSSKFPRGPV